MLIESPPRRRLLAEQTHGRPSRDVRRVGPVPRAQTESVEPGRVALPSHERTMPDGARSLLDRLGISRFLTPGWPLKYLLLAFPLWWILGLNTFIWPILAIPMLVDLRRRRPIKVPPLFWMWALYLGWQVLSLSMFEVSPPGTHFGSLTGRLISFGFNGALYAGITITMLYVGNLPLLAVPQAAVARWMGGFFLTVAAGGYLGVIVPRLSIPSLVELALPGRIAGNAYVKTLVHPYAAQIQSVLGTEGGRPSAPFGYTNSWANALSIVLVWFIAAWVVPARGRQKALYIAIAVATIVPIVISLNRGLWIGLIVTAVWFAGRQILLGRIGVLLVGIAVLVVGAGIFVATPLHDLIGERLQHGNSNDIRAFVAGQSIKAAGISPVLGYGGTRHADGSANSIAVGPTSSCPNCGSVATGSTGQLWAIMFNQGYVGVALYFGFFALSWWRYRRERGAVNEAAAITLVLVFVYMWFYSAIPAAPTLSVIAVSVLWRSRSARLAGTETERVSAPRRDDEIGHAVAY